MTYTDIIMIDSAKYKFCDGSIALHRVRHERKFVLRHHFRIFNVEKKLPHVSYPRQSAPLWLCYLLFLWN